MSGPGPDRRLRRASTLLTFALVTGTSLAVWRTRPGAAGEGRLSEEELVTWLVCTGAVSGAFALAMLVFWRERPLRSGIATGLPLALLAIVLGVGIDVVRAGGG